MGFKTGVVNTLLSPLYLKGVLLDGERISVVVWAVAVPGEGAMVVVLLLGGRLTTFVSTNSGSGQCWYVFLVGFSLSYLFGVEIK